LTAQKSMEPTVVCCPRCGYGWGPVHPWVGLGWVENYIYAEI